MVRVCNLGWVARALHDHHEEDLPEPLAQSILDARGSSGALMAIVDDPDAHPGRSVAHAIELLGRLKHLPALSLLIDMLRRTEGDWDFYAHDAIVAFGPLAVPMLLRWLPVDADLFGPVLAECAETCRDPQVRQALCEVLQRHPELGAHCAKLYGDVTLTEELLQTLMRLDPASHHEDPWLAATEIVAAVCSFDIEPGPLALRQLTTLGTRSRASTMPSTQR
ncbi:MAG: hypothetical protein KTR31_22585 [Myxococcales bacterium]|nr:hypothetical protein [Myxococcales bacterium]